MLTSMQAKQAAKTAGKPESEFDKEQIEYEDAVPTAESSMQNLLTQCLTKKDKLDLTPK